MNDVAYHDGDNFIRNCVTIRTGKSYARPIVRKIETIGYPVSAQEIIDDLRIDSNDEIETVQRNLAGACGFLERRTAYVFAAGNYQLDVDAFGFEHWLTIDRGPLRQINEIAYLTAKDTYTAIDPSNYWTRTEHRRFHVHLMKDFAAPTLWEEATRGGVRISFQAGFDTVLQSSSGDQFEIDDDLRSLLLLMTGHFYKNREMNPAQLEAGAGAILGTYRQLW